MRKLSLCLLLAVLALNFVAISRVSSQTTDQKPKESAAVTKLMGYGKKEPGKVFRDEVTDERLLKLFDLADSKKEGFVTKDQLVAAAAKLEAEQPQGGRQGGPDGGGGGGGGFGGGPGGGRGGFGGGPGGPGGRPQLGTVLPKFIQDELALSDDQKQKMADLQKEVDTKIDNILNDEQKKKFKEMKENFGRGGPGGGGGRGPGGPGGRGGPPPQGL